MSHDHIFCNIYSIKKKNFNGLTFLKMYNNMEFYAAKTIKKN